MEVQVDDNTVGREIKADKWIFKRKFQENYKINKDKTNFMQ